MTVSQSEPTRDPRLYIITWSSRSAAGLAEDVRKGLTAQPKRFLPKYFYDELGSQLFEAICLLPEYYLTRAENEILQAFTPTRSSLLLTGRRRWSRWAAAALQRRD